MTWVTVRRSSPDASVKAAGDPTPALFTRTSTAGFVLHVTDERVDLFRVREVGGMGGATELGSERPYGVLAPSDECDRGPSPGEGTGKRLADAS